MTILYFDIEKYSVEQLGRMSHSFEERLNDKVLFLPKDFHVILNATVEQLEAARKAIDAAIEFKKST